MKIILSRKGFDSSSGGCPSPIFPDGSLYSLPIPDKRSSIRYRDLKFQKYNVGDIVYDLSKGRSKSSHFAHLDPDLNPVSLKRRRSWKPVLGQAHSAQGHLRKQGVEKGDLFLFFGLYREVECENGNWHFTPKTTSKHILWGWLQIGSIVKVDEVSDKELLWARYHPHFGRALDQSNTLYIAADRLHIQDTSTEICGGGVFDRVDPRRVLTKSDGGNVSDWKLPRWFYPSRGKPPLSFHGKKERWRLYKNHCELKCAARGQEFVLQADHYPEVYRWLKNLFEI